MEYTQEEKNLILLASADGFGYKDRVNALLLSENYRRYFPSAGKTLIKRDADGVYNKVREKIGDRAFAERILGGLEKSGTKCVTLASKNYPNQLKEIPAPPIALFYKGELSLLEKNCFGIVGSRHTLVDALALTKKFAKELSSRFSVITGTATGADSAAIDGAGSNAVAALAFGFDYIRSQSNANVLEKTAKTGLIISEYHPSTAPKSFLFPARNRIIAGLSEGVLVVSAGKKSGALITAGYATRFGKEVFALPYSPGITSGEGCNGLIKSGATLVTDTGDILSAFGMEKEVEKTVPLTGEEQKVYNAVKELGEAFAPAVADKLGVQAYKLIPVFSSLEIKGLIIRLGGNRYAAV